MATNTSDRESERKTHSDVVVGLMIAAVVLSMTIYGVAMFAQLIAEWFVRLY